MALARATHEYCSGGVAAKASQTMQLFLLVGLTVECVSAAAVKHLSRLDATGGDAPVSPLVAANGERAPRPKRALNLS